MVVLIRVAMLTVVLPWTVLTWFSPCGTRINKAAWAVPASSSTTQTQRNPTYRDFAHVAFTIGMCYSADSPHGALPRLLSYVFGAATVGGSVNLIAGLIRSISAVRKAVCVRPPRPLLAECEYVGLDAGCEEGYLEGAVVN